jgi:hypothetical protein
MRFLFCGIALVLFIVAGCFANQQPFCQVLGATGVAATPNMVAGLAAFGFALAGGLSLLAAALVKEKG